MSFNLATILTETALAAPEGPLHLFMGTARTYGELDEQWLTPPSHRGSKYPL